MHFSYSSMSEENIFCEREANEICLARPPQTFKPIITARADSLITGDDEIQADRPHYLLCMARRLFGQKRRQSDSESKKHQ